MHVEWAERRVSLKKYISISEKLQHGILKSPQPYCFQAMFYAVEWVSHNTLEHAFQHFNHLLSSFILSDCKVEVGRRVYSSLHAVPIFLTTLKVFRNLLKP